jgi:hypothetical protein
MNANLPTIARLKAMDVEGVVGTCRDCHWTTCLPFANLSPARPNALSAHCESALVQVRRLRLGAAFLTPEGRGMNAAGMSG